MQTVGERRDDAEVGTRGGGNFARSAYDAKTHYCG